MSDTDQTAVRLSDSCLDPTVLAAYPHSLALNDPPGGYPVVISSFGTSSGFVLPSSSGTVINNASITGGNLVLTPDTGSQAGIGLYGTPVAVGAGVQVEFTYTSKGGSGADGIAFFVLDASQVSSASSVVPGGFGGGLGYADDGRAGITGGVLGVGFDTYGNYSAADKGPQTGTGRSPNSVDIRGAGNAATSGYALLNTTPFAPGIDGTRTAKVTLIPNGASTLVSVAVSTDGGKTFTTVIDSLSVAQALPSTVYYGFSASTGGSTDLHEINAMAVQLLTDPEIGPVSATDVTTGTNNPSTIAPGDSVTYSYSVVNNGPNGSSQLALTDNAPSNLVGETYTIVDSLGTHTGTGAPDVGNLNLSSGATATVSVSGTVDVHATSGNLSHVITVVPGASYASSNPAGGTATATIGGTSSSLFLQDADAASAITGAGATVLLAPAAVVVDESGAAHTVSADVHEANTTFGTLALASGGPLTGTYNASTGDLTFSGTVAQVQAELRDVEFVNVSHTGSSPLVTQGYTFTLTDATTGKQAVEARASTSISSPSASGPVGGNSILDTGSDTPFSAVSVSEANTVPLTATVTVNAANGDFTAASASGWNRSASGTLVTYTRTYSASGTVAAAAQAGLQALSFQPVEHAIAPGSSETDGFGVMVADGAGTGTPVLSGTDTVTAVHDLPSVSGAVGGQSISDETVAVPFSTTTIADPDDTSLVVVVSEVAGHGDFTPASASGWSRSTLGGMVSYTETFAAGAAGGAASAANAAVGTLTFQPTAHALAPGNVEQDVFSLGVTDGLGSAATSGTGTVTVTATHDTPGLTDPATLPGIPDTGSVSPYASATVVDPDNTPLTLTVTVAATTGDFTDASSAAWTRVANPDGSVTYSETFADGTSSAAAAQASLQALTFQPTAHALAPGSSETDSFTVQGVDGAGTPTQVSSKTVTVTATHDAPVVSGGIADQATTAGSTILPFGSVQVVDPDHVGLVASVTVQGGASGTGDLVAGSTVGWTRTVQGSDTVFSRTFVYQTGVDAVAQDAIRSLAFMPERTGTTAFSITVSDTASTPLTSVADASNSVLASVGGPSVTGGSSGQPTADTASVSAFAAITVIDPDTVASRASVTVSGGVSTGDDLTSASAQGWTRTVQGTDIVYTRDFPAGNGEAADIQAAVRMLVLQPAAHVAAPGTQHVVELPLAVSDIYGTSHGDSSVNVTAATDQPILATTTASLVIADVETATPFSGLTVSEPDDVPATATVVIADGVDQGDFTAASAAGFTRSVSGKDIVYTLTLSARADVGAALEEKLASLVFQPVKQVPGTAETTAISLATTFGSLGSGQKVDIGITSGGSLYPYPDLYARDANPDAVITVTASLPTGTAGHYATLGIGHVGDDSLVYVVSGTAAQVTAALHAVTFVPDVGSTLPASYTALVAGDGNQAQLVDLGTGDNQLSATDANDTVVGGPGSDTIYGSATDNAVLIGGTGHNLFVSAQGHTTVFSGAAGSVFYGGTLEDVMIQSSGPDTFYGGGGDATVFGGTGRTQVFGDTGNLDFEGFSGAATVQGGSGHNAIYGGTAALTVYGGGSGIYTGGTSGGNLLLSGTGDSTLVGGGNGDEVVAVGGGTDVVAAGSGSETVTGANATGGNLYFGGTGNALIAVGGGQSTVIGGPGTDTVFAGKGSGSLVYYGGTGADFVVGSTFLDTFVVSSGNDTLVGSGGTDSYVLDKGHAGGTVTVEDFKVGTDTVNLFGYAPDEVSGALARETVSGNDTTLLFSDGTRMTFVGVQDVSAAIHHGNDVS